MARIKFFTTGGTIDKVYFDAASAFEVGESVIEQLLREALVDFEFECVSLMRKDSLEMTDDDRASIRTAVESDAATRIIVTHGTDTMVDTALALEGLDGKTIVLTGALTPARFRSTDAIFNVGMAVAAAQSLPAGVYVTMSGQVFAAGDVVKNRDRNRFEVRPAGGATGSNA
ncbi:MAG: asparaginase domain-containing protein [Pseudomonadota bacterium]